MKKITSIILTITMLLSMSVFSAYASDSMTIDTPADGSTIENVDTTIQVSGVDSGAELIFEFDGKTIDSAELTSGMLTIGEHTITAYAIGSDGKVVSAKSTFKVIKQIKSSTNADFDYLSTTMDCSAAAVALYPDPNKSSTSKYTIKANRASAKKWAATVSMPDGRTKTESTDDIAVNMTSSPTFSSGAPFFICEFPSIKTVAVFEHDIKINNVGTILHYEMKYGSNKTWYAGGVATVRYIDKNGYFFGNSQYVCDPDTWYRLKTVCNFMTGIINVYATNLTTNETINVFSNQAITAGVTDLYQVRITYFNDAKNGGITVDNVTVSEAPEFTGIKDIDYIYGEELSADEYADASLLTGLKVYMNEPIIVSNFINVPVSVTDDNGISIVPASLSVDKDSNAIIIELPDSPAVNANTKYNVSVCLAANYSGLTDMAVASFKTAADSYAVTGTDMSVNGVKLLTLGQLKGGKLNVDVTFANDGDAEPIAVILAVRSENKLVGLDIVVPEGGIPNSDSTTVTLETESLPEELNDATVQIIFLNDLSNVSTAFVTYEKSLN